MIILPCIAWILAHGTYLSYVFLLMFVFSLLFKLLGRSSRE